MMSLKKRKQAGNKDLFHKSKRKGSYLEGESQLILGCPERKPRLEMESYKEINVGSI